MKLDVDYSSYKEIKVGGMNQHGMICLTIY